MNDKTFTNGDLKRQKLIKTYIIVCITGITLSVLPDIYYRLWFSAFSTLSTIVVYAAILLVNKRNPQLAAHLFIFVLTFLITLFSYLLGKASNVHLMLILVIVGNPFILDNQKNIQKYIHILHPSLFYTLLELTSFRLRFIIPFEDISPEQIAIFGTVNAILLFTLLPLISIVIIQSNYKAAQEIKQTNQALQERNDELSKINEELDQFAYRVSHDLRSPLNSVRGILSILEDAKNEDELKLYHQLMRKSVDKLDDFIREVLDQSLNNRLEVEIEEVDLKHLIQDIFEQMKYAANEKNIHFSFAIQANAQVFASDNRRLKIIFHNLLSNAIRYADTQKEKPFIDLKANVQTQNTIITLQDNGMGIDKEHIEKVFDMFYRANTSITGTGLGLYLVKECVDKLEGTIQLESEAGVGTTFILTFPNQSDKLT